MTTLAERAAFIAAALADPSLVSGVTSLLAKLAKGSR